MLQPETNAHTVSQKRWFILAVIFLSAFAFLFSMQAAPPLIPAISQEFNLSHSAAATLMLFIALPALLLSIAGGFLADRFGGKNLCIAGLSLVSLGTLLTAVSPSFSLLQIGRFIVGTGGALILSAAPPLIFQWFSGRELNLAMGIWSLNMPLATGISFNLLGLVALGHGWRASFWVAAALAFAILIVFTIFAREKKASRVAVPLTALKSVPMWMLGFIWCFFNMAMLSLTTWGKTLFTGFMGIPAVKADFLASLVMLLALIAPLTGYLAGRVGRPRLLISISILVMTASLVLIPFGGEKLLVLLLVVLGLFAALTPPSIFALPPRLVGPENAGMGFGVLNTTLNLGIVTGPLLVGSILDNTDSEVAVFLTLAVFTAIGVVLTILLRIRQGD